MGTSAEKYKPSLLNPTKYLVYLDYFKEYVSCKDFKSLQASLKYVLTHKLPTEDFNTKSRLGDFLIRKGTTDFQFINYAYERKIKNYIEENLDTFDIFIDAGACIGEYCVWLANKGKRCIAIEPVNFIATQKNIELNNLQNKIQLFSCGLGSKKERVYFNIPDGAPGASYIDKNSKKEPNVDIETFDDLVERMDIKPSDRILMKMDVEGMEVDLIQGAKKFIQSQRNLSFIYEHFAADNYRNDKALLAISDFKFNDIDSVNRLAKKL